MEKVISRDGTAIAFDRSGEGQPVILVGGAFNSRSFGPNGGLAALLADHFTVINYDRRGRGDSGDAVPYSVEREVEDIEALIEEAGGSACVYGISSGAALALEAANRGLGIEKLALYEAPFVVDNSRTPVPNDYLVRLEELVASGRRGDAVRLFMSTSRVVRDLPLAATSKAGSGERGDLWRCKTIRRSKTSWSGWDEVPSNRRVGGEQLRGGTCNLSPARLLRAGRWDYGRQDPQTCRTLPASTWGLPRSKKNQ